MCQKREGSPGSEHPAVWVLARKPLPDISGCELRPELGVLLVIGKRSSGASPTPTAGWLLYGGRKIMRKGVYVAHQQNNATKWRKRQGLLQPAKQRAYRLSNRTVSSRTRIKHRSHVTLSSFRPHSARQPALGHRLLKNEADTHYTLEVTNKHTGGPRSPHCHRAWDTYLDEKKGHAFLMCHVVCRWKFSVFLQGHLSTLLVLLRRFFN